VAVEGQGRFFCAAALYEMVVNSGVRVAGGVQIVDWNLVKPGCIDLLPNGISVLIKCGIGQSNVSAIRNEVFRFCLVARVVW